jgi:hypothetical protein
LIFFVSLNALATEEGVIFYGNAFVVGKEYIHDGSIRTDSVTQAGDMQTETVSDDHPYIFIAENALIYGREQLLAKPNTIPQNMQENTAQAEEEKPLHAEDDVVRKASVAVFSAFPFRSSPSSYSPCGMDPAIIVSKQRTGVLKLACKANRDNAHLHIKNTFLPLYSPEQRQKMSIAATQYGLLTSFGPNSPSLS